MNFLDLIFVQYYCCKIIKATNYILACNVIYRNFHGLSLKIFYFSSASAFCLLHVCQCHYNICNLNGSKILVPCRCALEWCQMLHGPPTGRPPCVQQCLAPCGGRLGYFSFAYLAISSYLQILLLLWVSPAFVKHYTFWDRKQEY